MSKRLELASISQAILDLLTSRDKPSDFDTETAIILVCRYPTLRSRLAKAMQSKGEKVRWVKALESALGR